MRSLVQSHELETKIPLKLDTNSSQRLFVILFRLSFSFQKLANHLVRFQQVKCVGFMIKTFTYSYVGRSDEQRGWLHRVGAWVLPRKSLDGTLEYLSVTFLLNMIHLHLFSSVYSNLGFGFAFGCVIIIAEIIYAKLTRPRSLQSGCCTSLLLLTLSAILTTVTSWMIAEYYDP